jgi:hypothetical protein
VHDGANEITSNMLLISFNDFLKALLRGLHLYFVYQAFIAQFTIRASPPKVQAMRHDLVPVVDFV